MKVANEGINKLSIYIKDLDATATTHTKYLEDYAKFDDHESVEKKCVIKDYTEQVETPSATIVDCEGGIASSTVIVEDLSANISDTDIELSTSSALRANEKEGSLETEKELLTILWELTGATPVLKKSPAFVQFRIGRVDQQEPDVFAAITASPSQTPC